MTRYGVSVTTFRVAALYAIDCGRTDQSFWLDRHYNDWIRNLHPRELQDDAHKFYQAAVTCGIAHYCVGDLKGAIRIGQEALEQFTAEKDERAGRLAANLAYFFAEWFAMQPNAEYAVAATQLIDRAAQFLPSEMHPRIRDTAGFVLIQTGSTPEEVEKGLTFCRESHEALMASDDEDMKGSSRQFFELHREIAYQRLADLTRSPTEN